jgi:hypothetical protein
VNKNNLNDQTVCRSLKAVHQVEHAINVCDRHQKCKQYSSARSLLATLIELAIVYVQSVPTIYYIVKLYITDAYLR